MNVVCYLYYADAAGHLSRLIAHLRREANIAELVIVYNSRNLEAMPLAARFPGVRLIPYDGGDWEFRAYQLGVDEVTGTDGGVLIINDTAGRNYPLFDGDLRRLAAQAGEASGSDRPTIVGKVETNGRIYRLAGNEFSRWIRSNIFYLNRAALKVLNGALFDGNVFSASRHRDGRLDIAVEISDELKRYLLEWLSPGAGKRGWLAHARRGNASDVVLRGKLGSILLEKHLSARLAAAGAHFASYEPPKRSRRHELAVWLFFKKRRLKRVFGG